MILGISGGTGSGKTTIAKKLLEPFPSSKCILISQDSYYKDLSHFTLEERKKFNFDHPDALDLDLLYQQLLTLLEGKSIEQPLYSFENHTRTEQTIRIEPKELIVVEGILLFQHKALRELFDLRIFVETDTDIRLLRRLKRDMRERERTLEEIVTTYENVLKPMHLEFVEPTKHYADFIIQNTEFCTTAVASLQSIIQGHLDRNRLSH